MEEIICCPVFDPVPWDGVNHEWKEKLFISDSIVQCFHVPLPGQMGKVIGRMWKNAEDCSVSNPKDFLLLAHDPSPWKSVFYMSVMDEHPNLKNPVRISGHFVSKAFDGPYQNVPSYIKETDAYLKERGLKATKYYFYYTTCPKCAKKYGHNWIVVFAQV
jgi:hypothetical protein